MPELTQESSGNCNQQQATEASPHVQRLEPLLRQELAKLRSTIARPLLDFLATAGLDDSQYLEMYPEVRVELDRGTFSSGLEHYIIHGLDEGRRFCFTATGWPEERYLRENPDVTGAINAGQLASGLEHFLRFGQFEGRPFDFDPKVLHWNKMRLIGYLAAVHGYRHYLEICTTTTGNRFRELDRQLFLTHRRLMYLCSPDFADGLEIDFRSSGFEIGECLRQITKSGIRPDILLVDGWHEYETARRDIEDAFELVADGGSLVVHDCFPRDDAIASPQFVPGDWSGVTYKAYLDFVTGHDDLEDFVTVDIDYGCGVIRKAKGKSKTWRRIKSVFVRNSRAQNPRLIRRWRSIGNDFESAFKLFKQHHRELLNLISLDEFVERNRIN